MNTPNTKAVLDLLAVIHRDGGHHTGNVGIEQSCKDASKKILQYYIKEESMNQAKQEQITMADLTQTLKADQVPATVVPLGVPSEGEDKSGVSEDSGTSQEPTSGTPTLEERIAAAKAKIAANK